MTTNMPVVPLAGSTLLRACFAALAFLTRWYKDFARARRHRREARVLASLDSRMLADIGVTRGDVRDAFSEPFWEDPTALLCERANERRLSRSVPYVPAARRSEGFSRPRTDRPALHTV